ncbi:DEAD/DEAH box helicase [Clostridium manihotivorum]|uniref:ATP-dependent helicase n=1 Tax=Clostridium manihotivorum TaxID=2320868 RepID=A0A410DRZ3_9CLOT|nr:DEAD/DEAH box helicase [Clostridium manihotivorum]QAA31831.1 ATP-dependent helicase [Clostridium manihotivorum]
MSSFDKLSIPDYIIEGLSKSDILNPTSIQEKVIPLALENKDIIGKSQTGSGKTLAYLIPIFNKIDSSKREMQAIVLAPTHELVMQIDREIKLLATNSNTPVTSITIIGEVNIKRQVENLKNKPHIIVGTPGRVLELIKLKKISGHTVKTIVIDEGDRLLNDKNISSIKDIIKTTLKDRQLMFFSATITPESEKAAKELMKEPIIIKLDEDTSVSPTIDHLFFVTERRDKIELLRKLIYASGTKKAIVFINKSEETETTTLKLQFHKVEAYGIYGDSTKEERKKALEGFRNGKYKILVASDIAARGLDVKGVTHIFHLDLPEDPKEYLHRAGRTGRAGKSGTSISIVTDKEIPTIHKYENTFNIKIHQKEVYKGQILELEEMKQLKATNSYHSPNKSKKATSNKTTFKKKK